MKTLSWIALTVYGLFICIIVFYMNTYASPELVLESSVKIQRQSSSGWQTVEEKRFRGISGIQYLLDEGQVYRLIVSVEKPFDLEGVLRVRMVTRSDGTSLPKEVKSGQIIFGPHTGCPVGEKRCEPLSIDDVGLVEVRLDVEKAQFTGLGVFTLRPFTEPTPAKIRPSIQYKDSIVSCGSTIKDGFWLFAPKIRGNGSRVDSISVCLTGPKGKVICAEDGDFQVKKRVTKKGRYTFTIFDERVRRTDCGVTAI